MTMNKEVCWARIAYDCWGHSGHCQHKVTTHEEAKPWCTVHAPSYVARKRAESEAKWDAERKARETRYAHQELLYAKADLYPELVKALRDAVDKAEGGVSVSARQFTAPWKVVLAKAKDIEKEAQG